MYDSVILYKTKFCWVKTDAYVYIDKMLETVCFTFVPSMCLGGRLFVAERVDLIETILGGS